MRAREFITESIELSHEPTSTGGVQVYAYIDGKEAGWVRFTKLKTGQVKAAMVHVPERLRRQGIGSAMYKYARHELGLDIVPSDSQTADGRAFWKKIHENVTEDSFDGIDIDMDIEDDEIMVTAMANGRELGHVLFVEQGEYLMPQDLEVDERFQGQGIAAAMYDYVKSKGYKIRRSGQQTDAGAGFWSKHRPEQNVWENESSKPTMGINVRSDGDIDYADLIIDGKKKYESRQTDSLRPYVGKTVAIVRTGKGPAVAIGQVTVGEPVVVDAEKFDKMRKLHLVPQGSKFDIGPDATKYLYPMINPVRWDNEKLVKQRGIVARKIDEDNLDDNIKLTHTMSPDMLYVHASQDGSDAGGARFKKIDGEWTGDIVHVYPQFRRQGIATKMYNYAEDLVGKIIPSKTLKPKGKKFWASRVDRKIDESTESTNHVLFLGPNAVIVGQEHGKPLKLSDEEQQKIKDIADKYGAWYEGNGMDQKHTKGIIDDYKGSWDDDLLSPSIKGYPSPFLYVLFSNIKENDTVDGKIGFDPKSTIFDRILDTQPSTNYFPDRKFDAETLQKFLKSVSENQYDFVKMSQAPATEKNVRKFFTQGEKLMFPDNWEEYPYRAGRVAKSVNDLRDKFLATRKKGVYVAGSDHLKAVRKFKDKK